MIPFDTTEVYALAAFKEQYLLETDKMKIHLNDAQFYNDVLNLTQIGKIWFELKRLSFRYLWLNREAILWRISLYWGVQTINSFKKTPTHPPSILSPILMTMFHRTSDSWAWANDRAQSRRYDAVCETDPRTYSIVWIPSLGNNIKSEIFKMGQSRPIFSLTTIIKISTRNGKTYMLCLGFEPRAAEW